MAVKDSTQKWIIMLLVFAGSAVSTFCQFTCSIYGSELMEEYTLTTIQFSAMMMAPMLVGMLFSFFAGMLGDRFGVKRNMVLTGVISLAGAVIRICANQYMLLFLSMVFLGVFASFNAGNAAKLFGIWFPVKQVGIPMGFYMAGGNTGIALSQAITPYLPDRDSAFVCGAFLMAAVVAAWILLGKEKKIPGPGVEKFCMENVKEALKLKDLWIIGLGMAVFMGMIMTVSGFLPTALNAEGIGMAEAGGMASLFIIGNIFGNFIGPVVIQKVKSQRISTMLSAFLGGIFIYAAWLLKNGCLAGCFFILSGIFMGAVSPVIISRTAELPNLRKSSLGTAGGMVTSLQMLGAFLIPTYIVAAISGSNYEIMFIIAAVLAILTGIISHIKVTE